MIESSDNPAIVAERLALAKAQTVAASNSDKAVIGADTIVVLDDAILGKPRDESEAADMLRRLRSEWHEVITAVAIISNGRSIVEHVSTKVKMRSYTDDEIAAYVASGDPMDKAGAYAVQHPVFAPVESIDGCYLNVVGLPLCLLARMLRDSGVAIRPRPEWSLPQKCQECEGRGLLTSGAKVR